MFFEVYCSVFVFVFKVVALQGELLHLVVLQWNR